MRKRENIWKRIASSVGVVFMVGALSAGAVASSAQGAAAGLGLAGSKIELGAAVGAASDEPLGSSDEMEDSSGEREEGSGAQDSSDGSQEAPEGAEEGSGEGDGAGEEEAPGEENGADGTEEGSGEGDGTGEEEAPGEEDGSDGEDSSDDTEDSSDEEIEEEPEEPELDRPVLKAASKPDGSIKLSWGKIKGAAEYAIMRSTKKDSGFHKIYTAKAGSHYYIDKGRVPGKAYYYQLIAFSEGHGEKSKSKTVKGCSLEQVELSSISNLSGSQKLALHWKPVKGADSYQIMRKEPNGKYKAIGSVKGAKSTYTDTGRNGGTTYAYKICAKDSAGGRGGYSHEMSQMAIDKNKKMIALTYDDGPSIYTPVVLKALEKYKAHATFFVVGNRVRQYVESIRKEAALGCEIGNHTYDHTILSKLGAEQVKWALSQTNQVVKEQAGVDIRIMRPPGGGHNATVRQAASMPVIMWSIDTLDWKTRNTAATVQCVMDKAYDGAIVLMHDLHSPTANGADEIIRKLKERGYQLVTISEMAAYRGGMEAGKAYSQFLK